MAQPKIVLREEWFEARKALLIKEKEHMRAGDRLSVERRALPWVKVEKVYLFDAPGCKTTLSELFGGCSQLIIHHLMFHPDWEAGCPGCSFQAEHIDGPGQHLEHRDVKIIAVSRAPLAKIAAYKRRMGWRSKLPKAASNTTSGRSRLTPAIKARNCPVSACSTRMRTGRSFIHIPRTRGGWTLCSVGTTILILRRRVGTKLAIRTGRGVMMNTRRLRGGSEAEQRRVQ